jgi:dihydroorotate dehydrogenase (fumarate)
MNLTTTYLGLKLRNPLMPGASPLSENLDGIRRLEDAGAGAIVLGSLFAEQIERREAAFARHVARWNENFAEATTIFPQQDEYSTAPAEYLERIARAKAATRLPVIASLNGTHTGNWVAHARLIADAGADAVELNTYFLATRREVSGAEIEERVIEIARAVRGAVPIPVAVKLSPFYSSVAHLVGRLEGEGIDGVVLFNRFFQPEIDVDTLEVNPKLDLSTREDLRLRLRWLALLRDQVKLSLGCSGGVHASTDVVRALLAGADGVQVVSSLLGHGPAQLTGLITGLQRWMEQNEYASVDQMRGALSMRNCPDAEAYERGNYLRTLQLWRP